MYHHQIDENNYAVKNGPPLEQPLHKIEQTLDTDAEYFKLTFSSDHGYMIAHVNSFIPIEYHIQCDPVSGRIVECPLLCLDGGCNYLRISLGSVS